MNNSTNSKDNLTFSINDVAKVIGVVPATIRNWEKSGLFVAKRGENNYRIYTLDDIDTLKKIKELLNIQKNSRNGITQILPTINSSNPLVNIVERDKQPIYSKKLLNKRWKECRERKGYTLEEVSKAVGISPSHLSKLENGNANATLEVLEKIAYFYGESPIYFFDLDYSDKKKITLGQGEKVNIGVPGVDMESLIAERGTSIYPIMYTVEPGCGNLEAHSHSGQEFIFIMSGKIEIKLNDNEVYMLKKNDAFFFRSKEKHSWKNPSSRSAATLLWVHSPYDNN